MATYDYASKGVAGSGLGLGIAGTALGVLNASNGGGLLGGLFGGGCNGQVAALQSEIATLKAEKYSDKNTAEVYSAMRHEVQALSDRIIDKYVSPISQEIADMRVREARLEGKIGEVGLLANNGLTALTGQVNCLAATVAGITKTVVPNSSVCPGWGNVNVTIPTTTTTP